ncbi:uncharacterized protein E5676_scaffold232G00370 [Cucumis melo var. makuwa]|uniref:Retrotransposon gag domain-containing protein n=1 Tax=Cucumis melo var. makuwa TaxID=1194695 RepID=A0A5D3BJF6_CUCMM|nr:uncharacterized protein E5676_scaffold232G00370 [Cucumis melo var. makuwa]
MILMMSNVKDENVIKVVTLNSGGSPKSSVGAGNERFVRTPHEIRRPERAEPSDPEKAYEIEWLKKLGATKETEGWWKSILARCSDARTLNWQTFRGIFEDKYYPSTYCEAKRDEFMGLKQGSLSMAEYERKYTELLWYANVIVASESDGVEGLKEGFILKYVPQLQSLLSG